MGGVLTKKNKDKSGSPAAAQQGGAKGEQPDNGHGPTDGLTPDKKEVEAGAAGDATPTITTTPAPKENGAAAAAGDQSEKEQFEETKDDFETAVTTAAFGADNAGFAPGEGETEQLKTPEASGVSGEKKDDYVENVPASPAVDQFIQSAETPGTPADDLMVEAIADLAIQDQ